MTVRACCVSVLCVCFLCMYSVCMYVCVVIKMAVVIKCSRQKTSRNHQARGAGFVAFFPSFPPPPLPGSVWSGFLAGNHVGQ